jgi:hypothetical protein
MSKKYSFGKIVGMVVAVVAGMWGYNYYSQMSYGTPKQIVGKRAISEDIKTPSVQHAQTSDKRMSATEESLSNPGKNGSNRVY